MPAQEIPLPSCTASQLGIFLLAGPCELLDGLGLP